MTQPELGKSITELRKAKGLTQDELVQQCNLSIRTLQRIESGEVVPRSYTIKAIYKALGCEAFVSSAPPALNGLAAQGRFEQVYRYVFDLFNLKTNTMKKLTILSLPFVAMFLVMLSVSHYSSAQALTLGKLAGRWQWCHADGSPVLTDTPQGKCSRFKVISDNTFVVLDVNADQQTVGVFFLGTCATEGDVYSENIESTAPGLKNFKGVKNTFRYELKGDLLYLNGVNNSFNELWKRVTN